MITEEKLQAGAREDKINVLFKETHLLLLRRGEPIYATASGMSMYPFLKTGDKLKIAPIREDEIKLGDMIAVDRRSKGAWFTCHRVVKISEDKRYYFTKGDFHKEGLDEPVTAKDIAGKIVLVRRKNLEIDLERELWKYINRTIAKLSLSFPRILVFLAPYISLIIEWKLFLSKVKNRLKKGNSILYNTEEFILICVRKDLNEELKDKAVDLIKEGIDWETFCNYAMRGSITVLIYGALKKISGHIYIPGYVTDKLRSASIFIISRSVSQERRIAEILELFAAEDIPVMPLKGIILAKRLYGDIAARGLGVDFDLLIKENDKEKAIVLLKETGYAFDSDNEIKEWQWQCTFYKPEAAMIDLHWDITMCCRSQKRIDGFWDGTRFVEAAADYYEFKEEELLLYLCAHLTNSNAIGHLRYICDINELLNKYGDLINWDSIIKKAKEWKLSSSLYMALSMREKLFNSSISNDMLNKIKPSLVKRVFMGIFADKKFILRDCRRKKIMNLFLSYIFFELIEAKRTTEYWSVIRRVLFPPKEALMSHKNYNSQPFFLLYLKRLFMGFSKIFKAI